MPSQRKCHEGGKKKKGPITGKRGTVTCDSIKEGFF